MDDDSDLHSAPDLPPGFGRAGISPVDDRGPRNHITWAQIISMLRAWARETFSMRSLASGLKSMGWVLPLSVLIWVYAERELSVVQPETFEVRLHSSDPRRVIRLVDPADGKIRADLQGPQGNLEQLRLKLEGGAIQLEIAVPDSQLTPGKHQVLTSLVGNDANLMRDGITVSRPSPSEVTFFVDQLQDEDLDVLPPKNFKNLTAPPVFEPRKVHVTAPQSVLDDARAAGNLYAYARLDSIAGADAPGTHDLNSVTVALGFSIPNNAFDPATVAAHYEVKKSDASWLISSMPVWMVGPPGIGEQYKVEYEPVIANVTVTGPEEQIQAMKSPDFKPRPKAFFEVSPEDLQKPDGQHDQLLKFDLPPDVHVSADDSKRSVQFRLVERRSAE